MKDNIQEKKFNQLLSTTNWMLSGKYNGNRDPINLICKKCSKLRHFKQKRHFNVWVKCNCESVKITEENFINILEMHDQKLLSEYKTLFLSPIKVSCNKCNYVRAFKHASSFLKHPGCKKCNYKGKIYSDEEQKNKLLNHGFELISTKDTMLTVESPVVIKCLKCKKDKKFKQLKNALKTKCYNCCNSVKYNLEIVKNICQQNKIIFADEYFKGIRIYHNFICSKGHKICKPFSEMQRSFKKGTNGCKLCLNESLSVNAKDIIKLLNTKNIKFKEDYIVDGYSTRSHNKYFFYCNKCSNEWKCALYSITSLDSGCPNCSRYLNEKLTGDYLRELLPNINISRKTIYEKIYKNNKLIKKYVILDYYFTLNNQEYIVEYNGEQHYKPVNFVKCNSPKEELKSEQNFIKQQIRDNWLREYCKEKNITLIEIDGRKYKKEKIKEYLLSILPPEILSLKAGYNL